MMTNSRWSMVLLVAASGCGGKGEQKPTLSGSVEAAGAPVAGATVTAAGKSATTNDKGQFSLQFDGKKPPLVEVAAPGHFLVKLEGPSLHFACDPKTKRDCKVTRPIELTPAPAADGIYALGDGKLVPLAMKELAHDGTAYQIPDDSYLKLSRNGNLRLYVRGDQPTAVRQVQGTPPVFGEARAPVNSRSLPIAGGGEATLHEYSLPNMPDARWALATFTERPDAPVAPDGHRAVLFTF